MGAIIGGRLLRGASGAAGEVAWMPLGGDPQNDKNRVHGTLESHLSAAALISRWHDAGGAGATLDDLTAAARAGDTTASAVIAQAGRLGAELLLSVQAMLDPALVVIGGRLGSLPPVFTAVEAHFATIAPRPMRILPGALGARAAVLGIAAEAREAMFETLFGGAVTL